MARKVKIVSDGEGARIVAVTRKTAKMSNRLRWIKKGRDGILSKNCISQHNRYRNHTSVHVICLVVSSTVSKSRAVMRLIKAIYLSDLN